MEKKDLFRFLVLIGSLPWLHLLDVVVGLQWIMWMIVIQVATSLLYSFCKDDEKDNETYL